LNIDICKFESSQKDESRAQSADSSKVHGKLRAFIWPMRVTHCKSLALHVSISSYLEKYLSSTGFFKGKFRYLVWTRGGTGSGVPESTPAGFCVFLSDLDPNPESEICEKPDPDPEPLFNFGSRSLCSHCMGKLQLNRWL